MPDVYTLGVEEEYQLVDPDTRELCGRAGKVLATANTQQHPDRVQAELHRCQIEIATDVCHSLEELRQELVRSRQTVITAAQEQRVAVVAAGTHPFSAWQDQTLTDKARYHQLAETLQQTSRDLIIFGCHVHVGLNGSEFRDQPDLAIDVVNRCRLWLAPLLALTANSPFWEGRDTGYDSFRTELWSRLPTAGPPPYFANHSEYSTFVEGLIRAGVMPDITKLYWDIRLSKAFPTLEFRIADVCLSIDEAIMMAGLVRGIVRTSTEAARAGEPCPPIKSELLKAAHWTAARYGLTGDLIEVKASAAVPASTYINQMLDTLKPALQANHDWEVVYSAVQRILTFGNAASRQRQWLKETGDLRQVVDRLIEQTAMTELPTRAVDAEAPPVEV
ncbi:carboxylate-amine ligase [Nodosilinea sp. LEGE 06152]|uniref:carboxylate-amine ligase n=1 Tax=Nodosilinea sp. LEGE 06152 TaxID=2777966 RepID=UPI001880691F|nr:carboxylate-amine ligase [Nodosilinea sp. LEGE 06152]MBE9156886.1 carboxylate-amine ligase [Nodosilinea sp. LEGE 06152]